MAKLISKTYGEALYELAVEENKVDVLLEEASMVKEILISNSELEQFMNHPQITKDEKVNLIENSFKGRVLDELTGFLTIIVERSRFSEVIEIFDYFIDAIKELKNIGTAYVTTPMVLDEIQKAIIVEKLLKTTKYEKMEMNYAIDASLIGGMVVRIGDRVVDSSIESKLSELTRDLQKIQIN